MSRILAVFLFAAIFAVASAQYYSAYVPSYNYGYSNLGYASYGAYPSVYGAGVYGAGYGYPAYTSGLAYYKK